MAIIFSFTGIARFNERNWFRAHARRAMVSLMMAGALMVAGGVAVAQISSPAVDRHIDRAVNLSVTASDQNLTLAQALERVLQNNPELAAAAREISAFEGTKLQASVFRNPDFITETEEINSHNRNIQPFVTLQIGRAHV